MYTGSSFYIAISAHVMVLFLFVETVQIKIMYMVNRKVEISQLLYVHEMMKGSLLDKFNGKKPLANRSTRCSSVPLSES